MKSKNSHLIQDVIDLLLSIQAKYSLSSNSTSQEISKAIEIERKNKLSHATISQLRDVSLLDETIVREYNSLSKKGIRELIFLDAMRESLTAKEISNSLRFDIQRNVTPSTRSYIFVGHNKLDIGPSKRGHAYLHE